RPCRKPPRALGASRLTSSFHFSRQRSPFARQEPLHRTRILPKPRRLRRFSISDARFALFNIKRDIAGDILTLIRWAVIGLFRSRFSLTGGGSGQEMRFIGASIILQRLFQYPRSEPDCTAWSFARQINLTGGRRSRRPQAEDGFWRKSVLPRGVFPGSFFCAITATRNIFRFGRWRATAISNAAAGIRCW